MKSIFVSKAYLTPLLIISLSATIHAWQLPSSFFQRLTFSQRSLAGFLEEVYNHKDYAQKFLALNFLHVQSGLELASQSKHPRQFARKMLRLFHPKLHHIFINPYALSAFLEQSIPTLSPLCNLKQERRDSIKAVKECIGSALINHYKQLRLNPDLTLTELAEQVIETLESEDCTVRELQHALHHFLSQAFSCLIWDPSDEEAWEIIKILANQLGSCADNSLIDQAMLDDILWTLLHHVTYYLFLAPQDVPSVIFDQIRSDLAAEESPLWSTPERESHITTKKRFLTESVLECEVWAQAHSLGYVLPT